jgi:protein-tyrosine phosphatase
VAATSANPSTLPAAATADEVLEHFDGVLDVVIDGGPSRHAEASTVVRVDEGSVEVLRHGVIPDAEILETVARFLLFVCSGNRCRSPLAAALASLLLSRRLGTDPDLLLTRGYRIESAGTDCIRGAPCTPEAENVAREYRLELSSHRARPVTPSLLEEADEVYVMTAAQKASISIFAPELDERVRLLDKSGADIEDPYRGGRDAYLQAARRIHRCLQARLDDL